MSDYMLIPYHLRERLSDALFMSEMCCDDIIEAVANAPLQASPRVVGGVREAAERVVKAFTALGNEHDQIATIMRHRECEASMTALQAALGEGK